MFNFKNQNKKNKIIFRIMDEMYEYDKEFVALIKGNILISFYFFLFLIKY